MSIKDVELRCAHKVGLSRVPCGFSLPAQLDSTKTSVPLRVRDVLMEHYHDTGIFVGRDSEGNEVRTLRHHNFRVYLGDDGDNDRGFTGFVRVHVDPRRDPKGNAYFNNYRPNKW